MGWGGATGVQAVLERENLRVHSYWGGGEFLGGQGDGNEELMGHCGTAGSSVQHA